MLKVANSVINASQITGVLPVANGGTGVTTSPAFSAYGNAIQSISNNTATKIAYNTSVFDTNSNYSTANARFTPTVGGYYQVNCVVNVGLVLVTQLVIDIYKNGATYQTVVADYNGGSAIVTNTSRILNGSSLVYLNGSTDYIEIYIYASNSGGSTSVNGYSARPDVNYFNAVMVRTT